MHTETRALLFGVHTDIPGRTQQPNLFPLGFTQISLGAHSNPISFLGGIHTDIPGPRQQPDLSFFFFFFWDSHRYPWAHTATRSLFFGIHTDIPRRTQQPDLFSLGFTQISLGAHSNPISLFFSFFWDSHRYPWAHTATRSLSFFSFFLGGFTQISLGAHSNPISLFFFFFLGFTQISLGAHSNPISLFFFSFFFLGFTQISLGTHSNPISFLWDSHRYPWAHTATRSLFFGIHTDIPGRTQQPNLSFFFFLFFGIHTDIPGRTQQPDLFSLGFTQISLGAHSNPISSRWDSHRYPWAHTATQSPFFFSFFFFFLGFTQISLGAHSNPISFLWDSHRFPWAHTATRSLLVGIHTDIYGRTQQPDLFSLGFTQISPGGKNSNPSSSRWDSHRYPWAHTATQTLLVEIHTNISGRTQQPDLFSLGFTQISLGAHSNPISSRWDPHRYLWAHTATRSLLVGIHTDFPGGKNSNPSSSRWDSHRYPWAHTATQTLLVEIHTNISGRTQQPKLFSLGFTQISLGHTETLP